MRTFGVAYDIDGTIVVPWNGFATALTVRLIALVDDAQPFQGQQVIDLANVFGAAAHQSGKAAGGDYGHVVIQLRDQPLQNAVNQSEVAVVQARLNAVDGVGGQHA